MLSSLKKQRLHKQPATSDPPHHPSLGLCAGKKTRLVSKRTGKKHSIVRRRQRPCRSSRGQDRATNHHATSTAQESGPHEDSSSSYQSSGATPPATVERACFPLDGTAGTQEHRNGTPSSASATITVIRQRVEKQPQQVEVSLDGLWLPSLSPSSGLGSPGTAAGRRQVNSNDGAAAATGGGRWADSSRQSMQPSASTSPTRKHSNLHVYDGREKLPRRGKVRPVTVGSHEARRCVQSHHLSRQEGEFIPARDGLATRLKLNDMVEGSGTRRGDGVMADDYDDGRGGGGGGRGKGERGGSGFAPAVMGSFTTQRGDFGDRSNRRGESAVMTPDISRDTASMLQRSQALVARAKVSEPSLFFVTGTLE